MTPHPGALLAHTWARTLANLPPHLQRGTRVLLERGCRLEQLDGHRAVVRVPEPWLWFVRDCRQPQLQRALSIAASRPMSLVLRPEGVAP